MSAASAAETATGPTPLTFTPSAPVWVAKSFGAVTAEPDVVQVLVSTSAMNASLYGLPTYSGNSSERNR